MNLGFAWTLPLEPGAGEHGCAKRCRCAWSPCRKLSLATFTLARSGSYDFANAHDVESRRQKASHHTGLLGEWGTIIVGPQVDREAHTLHACEHDVTTRRVPPVSSDPWDQIRKRFVERCRGDLHRLRESRSSGAYRDSAEALSVLAAVAHSLAGAGGTFGFPEISSRAVELETLLMEGKIDDRARAVLDQLIQVLETVSGRSD